MLKKLLSTSFIKELNYGKVTFNNIFYSSFPMPLVPALLPVTGGSILRTGFSFLKVCKVLGYPVFYK